MTTREYRPRATVPVELVELVIRRRRAAVTQGDMGRALGVGRTTIRYWETGVVTARDYQVEAYRSALVVLESVAVKR